MCLIAFAWKAHSEFRLIVAANRDEWHERPAAAAHWWEDQPDILAGRDLKAGGTWLGVTRSGRFAALTNFRDPADRKADAPSRGALVTAFLTGRETPRDYLAHLSSRTSRYQGFNLIVGDRNSLYYFSSRSGEILAVPPDVHALSNHTLNEPWPKVEMAKSALEAAIQPDVPCEARQRLCFEFLSNATIASDTALPDTGVGIVWERKLSPALIVGKEYGTRCSTVVSVSTDGTMRFEERTRDTTGEVVGVAMVELAAGQGDLRR